MRTAGLATLTADPNLRRVQTNAGERPVVDLRVALRDRGTTTGFITVVAWGALAERCQSYLLKGREIHVDGLLEVHEYERDGERRQRPQITATAIDFLRGPRSDEHPQPAATAASADDDIPF